ncbi:Voltagedependent Ltype calcium channel subunit beta2like [Caligus rogercresseyi]|uniref:Voltagedependent Ltype calcium channel subunit beta2like n=1 Tax=Caligus rogercresseyi TaxID=217165 RepID=A0A7T8GWA6_CALRO|nr:Voltagedependent Ltype calcium channel subunit beta2like [Caligus rogercresseyi]
MYDEEGEEEQGYRGDPRYIVDERNAAAYPEDARTYNRSRGQQQVPQTQQQQHYSDANRGYDLEYEEDRYYDEGEYYDQYHRQGGGGTSSNHPNHPQQPPQGRGALHPSHHHHHQKRPLQRYEEDFHEIRQRYDEEEEY